MSRSRALAAAGVVVMGMFSIVACSGDASTLPAAKAPTETVSAATAPAAMPTVVVYRSPT